MLIGRNTQNGAPAVAAPVHLHLPLKTVDLLAGQPSTDPDAPIHQHADGSVTVTTPVVGTVKIKLSAAEFAATQQQAQQARA